MESGFYTYIVECSDGTLYTGWTTNVEKRVVQHNNGKGAKYTKTRTPVVLKKYWSLDNRAEAMKKEYQIKQLSREEKLNLINQQE